MNLTTVLLLNTLYVIFLVLLWHNFFSIRKLKKDLRFEPIVILIVSLGTTIVGIYSLIVVLCIININDLQ